MYALLVLVVDTAGSSFYNSGVFVICAVLPAILFGLPAGVAVDVCQGVH
ncbi:MAG: hypothetical protein R2839_00495 [Thermomicrobiales bacterium]